MTLGKMPNMSRARAISIMKEKDFYQEYSPYDNEANGSTSNLDYTQGTPTVAEFLKTSLFLETMSSISPQTAAGGE